ncbi:TonB family protein [Sphingomonas cavernae]|uniref:Protein TonB n=2 Tax=Sphingomonas cavernae TaxID=2320861 RepID=A0A418WSN8_9SPHN|nr:TonB family protein [Sphingomonas cavernae]
MAINGAIIGALLFSSPEIIPEGIKYIRLIDPIEVPDPEPIPPEPIKQKVEPKPAPASQITPTTLVFPPKDSGFIVEKPLGDTPPLPGTIGPGTVVQDPPHNPIFVGPQIARKYLNAFQPPYPPGKQRLGEEGVVVVRVLVGADGRVKQVERVEAADDAFYEVTVSQALRKWRFTPATRDGVPVEGWREMTVRFEITG